MSICAGWRVSGVGCFRFWTPLNPDHSSSQPVTGGSQNWHHDFEAPPPSIHTTHRLNLNQTQTPPHTTSHNFIVTNSSHHSQSQSHSFILDSQCQKRGDQISGITSPTHSDYPNCFATAAKHFGGILAVLQGENAKKGSKKGVQKVPKMDRFLKNNKTRNLRFWFFLEIITREKIWLARTLKGKLGSFPSDETQNFNML